MDLVIPETHAFNRTLLELKYYVKARSGYQDLDLQSHLTGIEIAMKRPRKRVKVGLQSHLTGIEIVSDRIADAYRVAFNRTLLELK